MPTQNTALAFSQDETYREPDALKAGLKLDLGIKDTVAQTSTSNETMGNASRRNPVQLTSQFRMQAIKQASLPHRMVLDDIKQEFSCVITDIDPQSREFSARITDITNPENPDEQVSLSFDEIQESDQQKLTIGDSFIWYIGYQQGPSISRQSFSKIRFRRLPLWSKQEIETASTSAKELSNFFTKHPTP